MEKLRNFTDNFNRYISRASMHESQLQYQRLDD